MAAITAPLLLCVGYSGRASAKGLAFSQTQERPGRQSAAASTLKVVVLGSGAGPLVNVQRFGPSILIDAGNQVILFDCGRGATIRLAQIGIPIGRVNRVFLTHLHSDHVIGLPDLLLTAPSGPTGRKVPLEVWGPAARAR